MTRRPFEDFFKGQEMMNQAEAKFKNDQRRRHIKLRNRLIWDIQMAEKEGDIGRVNGLRDRVMKVNSLLRSA